MERLNDPVLIDLLRNRADHLNFNLAARSLFDKYESRLGAFFRRKFGFHAQLAKDLSDNTLAIFVENLLDGKEILNPNDLFGYLSGIADNLAWSAKRKKTVAEKYLASVGEPAVITEENPETLLVRKDLVQLVERKMQQLANKKCPCILQLWTMGYSFEEIADLLTYKDAGVARKTKHDCLQKLIALVKTD